MWPETLWAMAGAVAIARRSVNIRTANFAARARPPSGWTPRHTRPRGYNAFATFGQPVRRRGERRAHRVGHRGQPGVDGTSTITRTSLSDVTGTSATTSGAKEQALSAVRASAAPRLRRGDDELVSACVRRRDDAVDWATQPRGSSTEWHGVGADGPRTRGTSPSSRKAPTPGPQLLLGPQLQHVPNHPWASLEKTARCGCEGGTSSYTVTCASLSGQVDRPRGPWGVKRERSRAHARRAARRRHPHGRRTLPYRRGRGGRTRDVTSRVAQSGGRCETSRCEPGPASRSVGRGRRRFRTTWSWRPRATSSGSPNPARRLDRFVVIRTTAGWCGRSARVSGSGRPRHGPRWTVAPLLRGRWSLLARVPRQDDAVVWVGPTARAGLHAKFEGPQPLALRSCILHRWSARHRAPRQRVLGHPDALIAGRQIEFATGEGPHDLDQDAHGW